MKSDVIHGLIDLTRSQNDLRARLAKALVAGEVLAAAHKGDRAITQNEIVDAVKVARKVWDEIVRQEGSGGSVAN